MDAFVRGGGRDPLILADTQGITHALAEQGARLVGREYELLPVHQNAGVFHPKISAFLDEEDAHLLVGSGNLTFGGWGGNAELLEHFHTGNAPRLFSDLADYLELLATGELVEIAAPERIMTFAEELRATISGKTDNGRVRLLHNAGQTIVGQLHEEAENLGGATRICFAAPFYDLDGRGVRDLANLLNCEDIWGYVHQGGEVQGVSSSNWPHDSDLTLRAGHISEAWASDQRRLHAKSVEIVCRSGRLLLSGSANATRAGLFGPNSEAAVLRIFPSRDQVWSISDCSPPPRQALDEQDDLEAGAEATKVLGAELQGSAVVGKVMGGWPFADGNLRCSIAGTTLDLGNVTVGDDGSFAQHSLEMADKAWQTGRIILTLSNGDIQASGFLSVKAVSDLAKRTGKTGPRILAILSGTETPTDVAAIISWFHEDPDRLPRASSTSDFGSKRPEEVQVELVSASAFAANYNVHDDHFTGAERESGLSYAMRALLDAFRATSGPFNEEAQAARDRGELDAGAEGDLVRDEQKNEQTLLTFGKLLSAAMASGHSGAHAEAMLALAHYLTDRIRPEPEQVLQWVDRIQRGCGGKISEELAQDLVALAVLQVANRPYEQQIQSTRRFLVRHGLINRLKNADAQRLPAMASVIPLQIKRSDALQKIVDARTCSEELQVLLSTPTEQELPPLPALEQHNLWSSLRLLHSDPGRRERLLTLEEPADACPRCNIVLATSAREDLRLLDVSKCTNGRCGRLIAVVGSDHEPR